MQTITVATAVDTKTKSSIATVATACPSKSFVENTSSNKSSPNFTEHTTKIPCALQINHDLFSPVSIGSDSFSAAPISVKTPKLSAVRFSLDTKKHDGLCGPSLALEDIIINYIQENLISFEDLKSFCTKKGYHKHLSFVHDSTETLISLIRDASDDANVPLLRRGGGYGFLLTCANLEKIQQLHSILSLLV